MGWSGGCLCEDIRFETTDIPIATGHCHCQWCKRHSGSAFMTFAIFNQHDVRWEGVKPTPYRSSAGVERGFCGRCGSSLSFARPDFGELAIAAGVFDDPNVLKPALHVFTSQRCDWVHISDDLPTYERFPPGKEDRELK